jgi:hypothetical protein
MHYTTNGKPGSGRGAKDFHPDRPKITRPNIHELPVEADGELYYVGKGKDEGKTYIVRLFDAMFTKSVQTVAQHRKYNKGKSDPYNF